MRSTLPEVEDRPLEDQTHSLLLSGFGGETLLSTWMTRRRTFQCSIIYVLLVRMDKELHLH